MPFETQVYRARVREVNGHRLTFQEARENGDSLVWRVISARRHYSHWEYMFDDYVLDPNLARYLAVVTERGAERVTLKKLGTVKETLGRPIEHMTGADSLSRFKKIATLETFDKPRPRRRSR